MRTADLEAEWRAAQNTLTADDANLLDGVGMPYRDRLTKRIPRSVIMLMVGIAKVRICDGLYEPDELGSWEFIFPVRVDDDCSPYTERDYAFSVLGGDLVDLLCWDIDNPATWVLRCGAAEWLGCASRNEPTRIWSSPVNWLRNKCEGLVLLTADPIRRYEILSDCFYAGGVIAEDEYHADELERDLMCPYPRKPVLIN